VLEKSGAEAEEFLKRKPVTDLSSERGLGEVRSEIFEEYPEEVDDCASAATKEVGEDAQ
jgi:hypothetical protein